MPFWWLQRVTLRQISSEQGNRVQVRNLWESMWSRWWRNERGKETQLRQSECWDCVRWEKEENYADLEMRSGTLHYWISKQPGKGILFPSAIPGFPSPPGTCRCHWNPHCTLDRRKAPLLASSWSWNLPTQCHQKSHFRADSIQFSLTGTFDSVLHPLLTMGSELPARWFESQFSKKFSFLVFIGEKKEHIP